jgi:hypothetical protein
MAKSEYMYTCMMASVTDEVARDRPGYQKGKTKIRCEV